MSEKTVCPKCGKTEFVIIAGGCGQRSMMAYLCKRKDCGHRWNVQGRTATCIPL